MQHQNTLEPSLQMRGQSPVNCPDSDVKEWGQNINLCLGTLVPQAPRLRFIIPSAISCQTLYKSKEEKIC